VSLLSGIPILPSTFNTDWTSQQMEDWEVVLRHTYGGLELSLLTLLATVVFEVISLDTVRAVRKQPNGVELYRTAIVYNIVNHIVLGIPTYVLAALYICPPPTDGVPPSSGMRLIMEIMFIMLVHSIQYYFVHKMFHEHPTLYKAFHRLHHRFHTHVPPSAANTVTTGEYLVGYALPFAVASLLGKFTVRTSMTAFRLAITIISMLNLMVHTPKLEEWSRRWIPHFWVSTTGHLNHHRKLEAQYASPTFNIDNILLGWMSMMVGKTNG
jgi:sterol desaturase/sphingolipid hydroxylase (fatty acid hydroxylase superfamily)